MAGVLDGLLLFPLIRLRMLFLFLGVSGRRCRDSVRCNDRFVRSFFLISEKSGVGTAVTLCENIGPGVDLGVGCDRLK